MERTEQTRQLLTEATIRALRDDGYRATTTRRVADYAGVSLGAVAHHFPSRADLIAAALDRVSSGLIATIQEETQALTPDDPRHSELLLDVLWDAFTGWRFLVWLRVWLAVADDPVLQGPVVAADRQMSQSLGAILPALSPTGMGRDTWLRKVNVALDAIRGLSLVVHYQPGKDSAASHWPATRHELAQLLKVDEVGR